MTEKVIDSSTLAVFLLKERGWQNLRALLLEKPYTLELAVKEVANAIWRRTRLLGDISEQKAVTLLNDLLEIKRNILRTEQQDQYIQHALNISLRHRITLYDSLFIAQAASKKATLITSDKKQHEVAVKLSVDTLLV